MLGICGIEERKIRERFLDEETPAGALAVEEAVVVPGDLPGCPEIIGADAARDLRNLAHALFGLPAECIGKLPVLQRIHRGDLPFDHLTEQVHGRLNAVDGVVQLLTLHPAAQIQNFLGGIALNEQNAPQAEPADQDDTQEDTCQIQLEKFPTYGAQ